MDNEEKVLDGEIVVSPGNSLTEKILLNEDIPSETYRALMALRTKKIPKGMISVHPGKGDTPFRYVKHTHATEVLTDLYAAGVYFNWDVLDWEVFDDYSTVTRGKLEVRFRNTKGEWIVLQVTEVGAFEDLTTGHKMPKAMRVASAASRALPRAMMRMFGFGLELYPDVEFTEEQWWWTVAGNAKKKNVPIEEVVQFCKDNGIPNDNISGHYAEICEFIVVRAKEKQSAK